jgi:hypothetical protein
MRAQAMSDLTDIIRRLRQEGVTSGRIVGDPARVMNTAAKMLEDIEAATRFRSDGCARDVRRILHPEPAPEPEKEKPPCKGFHWLGQSMDHCDMCGKDISLHEGLSWRNAPDPFSKGEERVVPFDEARQRIPMFAHYVTPIGVPKDYAGPFRYDEPAEFWKEGE